MSLGANRCRAYTVGAQIISKAKHNFHPKKSHSEPQFHRHEQLPQTSSFRPLFSAHCEPKMNYAHYVTENPYHVLYHRYMERIAARDRNTLWISLQEPWQKFIGKAVIRKWCKKRVRVALNEALKEKGYDWEGRRIGGKGGTGLKGSLRLIISHFVLDRSWPEIQQDAKKLVHNLCKRSEQDKRALSSSEKSSPIGKGLR